MHTVSLKEVFSTVLFNEYAIEISYKTLFLLDHLHYL
ncbi:unnamed protein product, partial [Rotaria magnacalcarata]